MSTYKIIQKRIYDLLLHRQSVIILFFGFVLVSISALHFGETLVEWSQEKYHAVFNSFSDNIAGRTFQNNLCQHVPIDAVYTWVNGTDPDLISKLYKAKRDLAKKLNMTSMTSPSHCTYSHCVQSHLILVQPVIPNAVTLDDLEASHSALSNVSQLFRIRSTKDNQTNNYTVLVFDTTSMASLALENPKFQLYEINYTMVAAFLTDDWMSHNGVLLKDTFIVTGIPSGVTQNDLRKHFPPLTEKVFVFESKSLAILTVKNSAHVSSWNMTINNKTAKVLPAYLVIEPLAEVEDASPSRFADNEELRYSLRSLHKHAPWIRQIFLITNGQIPYWLNLENPRITIITHQEIFRNISDLPTFSSPAIECHIHRIPGLSEKFLYLNDDTFFGQNIWPDDFYTHSKGQKVYLSWPVPDCAEGCPSTWIRDGYCDRPCNNSNCEFDGGDCLGDSVRHTYPQIAAGRLGEQRFNALQNLDRLYCNPSCANSWLSDRYCDHVCNVRSCGFDAGDCGTSRYSELSEIPINGNQTFYQFPNGEIAGYFNLSTFWSDFGDITGGSHDNHPIVRTVAISVKFKVMTLVFQDNFPDTNVSIILKSQKNQFTLTLETRTTASKDVSTVTSIREAPTTSTPIIISTILPELRHPKMVELPEPRFNHALVNVTSPDLEDRVDELMKALKEGYLTEKGFNRKKSLLLEEYHQNISKMGTADESKSTMRGLKGLFPWEKDGTLALLDKQMELLYEIEKKPQSRHLLDTFSDSLRHVNKLYNTAFGYKARKVPAHMAHVIDRHVMNRLQEKFPVEYAETSSHRIRDPMDMQFSFSYDYFLMSEIEKVPVDEIFDSFDTDLSGTLSDREIRTLLTQLNSLPLQLSTVSQFEDLIVNCSLHSNDSSAAIIVTPHEERYYGSTLPPVTKQLIGNCEPVVRILDERFGKRNRNKFEIVKEDEVTFKMISSNLSRVLADLDDIRKTPKKFICLNDNIVHGSKDAEIIKAVLRDFYESFLPVPSSFELPNEYRNRFLHIDELRQWQRYRDFVRLSIYLLLVILIFLGLSSFCACKSHCKRNCLRILWIPFCRRGRVDFHSLEV